jgi:hypothetical protein
MKGELDDGMARFNHEDGATRSGRFAGAAPPPALAPVFPPHHLSKTATFSFGILPSGPFGGLLQDIHEAANRNAPRHGWG